MLEGNWGHRSIISRGLFSLQRYTDPSKSYVSVMMNLEKRAQRKRKRAMRSKNLTKWDPFPLPVGLIRASYQTFRCARWFGCLTFQYVSSLCLEMWIFPGSLMTSQALISQRIGSLNTYGRLWVHAYPSNGFLSVSITYWWCKKRYV